MVSLKCVTDFYIRNCRSNLSSFFFLHETNLETDFIENCRMLRMDKFFSRFLILAAFKLLHTSRLLRVIFKMAETVFNPLTAPVILN